MKRITRFFIFYLLFLFIANTVFARIVINELSYNPTSAAPGYQWLELFNNSDEMIDLEGWLIQTAGSSFSTVYTFPAVSINSGGFFVVGGKFVEEADIQTELQLPYSDGKTVGIRIVSPQFYTDTVLYGQPNINNLPDDVSSPSSSFAPTTPPGYSLARISDGYDTDNNAHDWKICDSPTPGWSNDPLIDLFLEDLTLNEIENGFRVSVRVVNPSTTTIPQNEATIEILINNESQGPFHLPELLPEYHTTEFYHFTGLPDGYYRIEITLLYQNDPNPLNNHLHDALIKGPSPLVINELLFKESSGNQEWVEIYNRSEIPLIMENFYLEDYAATRTNFNGIIPPKTYMVICRHKDRFLEVFYYVDPELVIESTSWAILNNDFETLFLADQYGHIFDYTEYSAPLSYPHDLSLERINPYDDESLWDRCIHPDMSTPAAVNSSLPLEYDLAILESDFLDEGNRLLHRLLLENKGYHNIEDFRLRCFAYYDEAETGVLVHDQYLTLPSDNILTFPTDVPVADYTTFRYLIHSEADLDPSNNFAFSYHNNNSLPVVINEIMFRPYVGEPRWIELKVNNHYKYLHEVTLETERYTVNVPLTGHEYLILVNNPSDSLFILENYSIDEQAQIITGLTSIYVAGEELKLYDPSANIFENFTYDSRWSNIRGVSAERINPFLPPAHDNWANSLHPAGSTPGRENSTYTPYMPVATALSVSPNPFSPGRGERTIISFELPERLSQVNCRIFDLKGRLVNTIINQEIFAARGTMIWDGKRNDGMRLPVGIYIIMLEATGHDSERIYRERGTVVIGR